jgi:GNAT superfamily N-acetyltransferase
MRVAGLGLNRLLLGFWGKRTAVAVGTIESASSVSVMVDEPEPQDDVKPEITVRHLRATDREGWQGLWDQYLRFYRADLPASTSDSTFARLCEGDGGLVGLLAVDRAGYALGFAHLVFHPSTWAEGPYCYLEDLFVDRAGRGAGVAGRLFEVLYETARGHGATRVYWLTQQYNGAARSLYDTVGNLTSFVVYEREL